METRCSFNWSNWISVLQANRTDASFETSYRRNKKCLCFIESIESTDNNRKMREKKIEYRIVFCLHNTFDVVFYPNDWNKRRFFFCLALLLPKHCYWKGKKHILSTNQRISNNEWEKQRKCTRSIYYGNKCENNTQILTMKRTIISESEIIIKKRQAGRHTQQHTK